MSEVMSEIFRLFLIVYLTVYLTDVLVDELGGPIVRFFSILFSATERELWAQRRRMEYLKKMPRTDRVDRLILLCGRIISSLEDKARTEKAESESRKKNLAEQRRAAGHAKALRDVARRNGIPASELDLPIPFEGATGQDAAHLPVPADAPADVARAEEAYTEPQKQTLNGS